MSGASEANTADAALAPGPLAARLGQIRARGKETLESALLMLDLYAVCDREGKQRLIESASRSLPAPALVARLVELARAETGDELREELLSRLFWIDIREIADLSSWMSLLSDCLGSERVRGRAAAMLARIVADNPAAQEALALACRTAKSWEQERALLESLCALETLPPLVRALFLEMLCRVDADVKFALLVRLCAGGAVPWETLRAQLADTEPAPIKRLVLEQLLERPLARGSAEESEADQAVARLLQSDPEASVRAAAVELLATRAGTSAAVEPALLAALQRDPDAQVRTTAMLAFQHSLERSEAALEALAQALSTERTREGLGLLLQLVSPLAGGSPAVRAALQRLLGESLRADLLEPVIDTLGRLAVGDPVLAQQLSSSLQTELDPRVRAPLLEGLLRQDDRDEARLPLYLSALRSTEPRLRALGVRGLLRLPLRPKHLAALGPAVDALGDAALDRWSRIPLARKLSRLTQADPERALASAFKRVAAQVQDAEVRAICEEAADRAAAAATAQAGAPVDWSEWLQRVEVEHRTEGIFPELLVQFDQNPEAARKILRAALNPPASETLYSTYRGQLSANTLVAWLRDRDLVDDDISRYCIAWLSNPQNHGGDAFFLGVLKSNPRYPPLREELWRLLDVRKEAPPVLLRELFLLAYAGAEDALSTELTSRCSAPRTPAQALLLLRFLLGNPAWAPARAALLSLPLASPIFADPEVKKLLAQLEKAMNLKLPAPQASPAASRTDDSAKRDGPGFADE